MEAAEEFERSYNFRFEEPDATEIVTHARNIESVRRKDDRRKKERESRADRKEEEKKKKEEELRRLKNLKKAEILEKLKKIQEISGAKNIPFSEVDLEADFDPNQYDEQMHGVFGDDYYVDEDPDGKPVFEDDIDIDDIPTYEEDGGEAPLEPEPEAAVESQESKKKRKKKKKKEGANEEEEAFVMDADYLEEAPAPPTKEGKVPKKELKKALDQYLEESYQLDFEDVVGSWHLLGPTFTRTNANQHPLSTFRSVVFRRDSSIAKSSPIPLDSTLSKSCSRTTRISTSSCRSKSLLRIVPRKSNERTRSAGRRCGKRRCRSSGSGWKSGCKAKIRTRRRGSQRNESGTLKKGTGKVGKTARARRRSSTRRARMAPKMARNAKAKSRERRMLAKAKLPPTIRPKASSSLKVGARPPKTSMKLHCPILLSKSRRARRQRPRSRCQMQGCSRTWAVRRRSGEGGGPIV